MIVFFGPQGPSRQARLMYETREQSNIWANYTSLQHVEWSKSSLMNATPPFCMEICYLHPIILQAFCKGLRFYSYKKWALTPQDEFQRGWTSKDFSIQNGTVLFRCCSATSLRFQNQPTIVYKEQLICKETGSVNFAACLLTMQTQSEAFIQELC